MKVAIVVALVVLVGLTMRQITENTQRLRWQGGKSHHWPHPGVFKNPTRDWLEVDVVTPPRNKCKVGLCRGMFQNYTAQIQHDVALFAAALPEKLVVPVLLNDHCEDWFRHDLDLLIVVGNEFPPELNAAIRELRLSPLHDTGSPKENFDLLSYPRDSIIVPHNKGRVFLMAWHNEASTGTNEQFDVLINTNWRNSNRGPELYYPLASRYLYNGEGYLLDRVSPQDLVLKVDFDAQATLDKKTRFLAFLHYSCDHSFYSSFAASRVALFDAVAAQYKWPDSLGLCRYNSGIAEELRPVEYDGPLVGKSFEIQMAVDAFTKYKFVITFENSLQEGYFSEKLVNGILANSIPVYGGTTDEPFVARFVNVKRFIYCKFDPEGFDIGNFDDKDPEKRIRLIAKQQAEALRVCVEKIRLVDQDDDLYMHMISQPFLLNNKLTGSIFDINRISANVRKALEDHDSYLLK